MTAHADEAFLHSAAIGVRVGSGQRGGHKEPPARLSYTTVGLHSTQVAP